MKRYKHGLSHYKLFSGRMAYLIPISWYEVLPGDTVQHATSLLLRFSPLLAPIMHPVRIRIHSWFVPHRLVWDQWEQFITGGKDGLGDGAVHPKVGLGNPQVGDLADHLGIRPLDYPLSGLQVSSLPFRSYNLIFNEFYRDQDLVPERPLDDSIDLANVAWQKDYFTSARPWPQKGPAISIPLGTSAPVIPASSGASPTFVVQPSGTPSALQADAAFSNQVKLPGNPSGELDWSDPQLAADLAGASGINVNDLREFMALQRYAEARAQFGSRYTEYLKYLGVNSADSRLQRPEYLGGGKATVAFSEVLQTAEGTDPVGSLKGHGISALKTRRFRRFFSEHGIVMTLMSVLPITCYQDGVHRRFTRFAREDYWQKELERIGQQEVLSREIFADGTSQDDNVFGYQNRYDEYRHIESSVAGDFRNTLNFWHLARSFATRPVLNQSFVESNPSTRIFADTVSDHLWCMANHSVQARRLVGSRTIGRIV